MDKNTTLINLSEHEAARFWRIEFDQLTPAERVFRSVWDLESDVNNGGFEQYYSNSAGDTAHAVVDALRTIGAHRAAAIVEQVNSLFGNGPPSDRDLRNEELESMTDSAIESLRKLDDKFIAYPDDLTELLFEYVTAHRNEIAGAVELGI